jgi:predicted TPR repeat methyltransferase
MKQRTADEGFQEHRSIPVRVYSEDPIQRDRIIRAQVMVTEALSEYLHTFPLRTNPLVVVELGCGTADISGPFTRRKCKVIGIDASQPALDKAKERFPDMTTCLKNVTEAEPIPSDVLIMCEFLEHMEDPLKLIKPWMVNANYAVISHPLNEPVDSLIAAGEHQWSFSEEDFENWFKFNGYELMQKEIFQMGLYTMILGVGRNANIRLYMS